MGLVGVIMLQRQGLCGLGESEADSTSFQGEERGTKREGDEEDSLDGVCKMI